MPQHQRSTVDAAGATVESVHVIAERDTALAGTPGFHSLARAMLHGLAGPGGAILAVFCACDDEAMVARITVRLNPKEPTDFKFIERGRGRIEVTPALDLRTLSGHFLTDETWLVQPQGWSQIGPVSQAKLPRGKAIAAKGRPSAERVAAAASADPECVCASKKNAAAGDPLSVHNPCSLCECPSFRLRVKGAPLVVYKRRA